MVDVTTFVDNVHADIGLDGLAGLAGTDVALVLKWTSVLENPADVGRPMALPADEILLADAGLERFRSNSATSEHWSAEVSGTRSVLPRCSAALATGKGAEEEVCILPMAAAADAPPPAAALTGAAAEGVDPDLLLS